MACRRRLASYDHAIPAAPALGRRPRSFTSGSANRPRLARKRLRIDKEATHRHHSRRRVVWKGRHLHKTRRSNPPEEHRLIQINDRVVGLFARAVLLDRDALAEEPLEHLEFEIIR